MKSTSLYISVVVMTSSFLPLTSKAVEPPPTLVFKNGFEGTTKQVKRNGSHWNLFGNDGPSTTFSDWTVDLKNGFGDSGQLNAEQGNDSQRSPEIVTDPVNPDNKVLRFRFNEKHITLPSGEQKARIQYEIFTKEDPTGSASRLWKEYYQKARIYFSPNMEILKQSPTDDIGWFVLQEYRMDPLSWIDSHPSDPTGRLEVELEKHNGQLYMGAKFKFPLMCSNFSSSSPCWKVFNTAFPLPLGKWMTQEIYIKQGAGSEGRFYVSLQPDGEPKTVIVDKIGNTVNPYSGPRAMGGFSPLKVYTEGKVIDWFSNHSPKVPMDIYWDNLEIWSNRRPESIVDSPLPPGVGAVPIIKTSSTTFTAAATPITTDPPAGTAPVVRPPAAQTARLGAPFSWRIVASNSPTAYNATGLPAGLVVDTRTGVISGTPTAESSNSVTIAATNPAGTGIANWSLNVTGATAIPPPVPASAVTQAEGVSLPGGWGSTRVGGATDGQVTEATGEWSIASTGGDIWNQFDGFQYVWKRASGDVTVSACVNSFQGDNPWAKAGVMLRESMATGSRNMTSLMTLKRGIAVQRRTETGGANIYTQGPNVSVPYCVRLQKMGTTVIASSSPDGAAWTEVRRETIALGSDYFVGLAVSGHDAGQSAEAIFDNVSVRQAASEAN